VNHDLRINQLFVTTIVVWQILAVLCCILNYIFKNISKIEEIYENIWQRYYLIVILIIKVPYFPVKYK